MRPEKDEAEARKCEAGAKTYKAAAEAIVSMNHATYKYILLPYCISYIIKSTSVRLN